LYANIIDECSAFKENKMTTNNSLCQFVKDGLVGVAVVLIAFAILAVSLGVYVFMSSDSSAGDFYEVFLAMMFSLDDIFFGSSILEEILLGPMPFVILTTFIGIGFGGRYLEIITSRREWEVGILKIVVISWLAVIGLSVICSRSLESIGFVVQFIIGGGIGAFFGLIVGGELGRALIPQKRFHKMILGALSSALVGCGGVVVSVLLR
jgi:hypothetical protein